MARIEGVNLPANKRIEYGLTYIFGIGLPTAQKMLNKLHIDFNKRVRELSDDEVASIQKEINAGGVVEGDLRKEIMLNIKRLQETGSYRGSRHKRGLPVRGQRTRTNARSRKGPRKAGSQIALKKVVAKK
jgi:small subunit ribosomal protein S13